MTSRTPLPPPPGSDPERDRALATAKGEVATRRATMLLLMLGSLVLVPAIRSFLMLAKDSQVLIDDFLATVPAALRTQLKPEDYGVIARAQWVVSGTILLFVALSLLLSIRPVRERRRGVIIYAIVMVSLCGLVCAANALLGVVAVLFGAVQAIAVVIVASCVLGAFVVCLFSLIGSYKAAHSASQGQKISLASLRYPPGYASGYGAQVATNSAQSTAPN